MEPSAQAQHIGALSGGGAMSRSRKKAKSRAWAKNQNRDQHVRKARMQGYRARSVFKLNEIDCKHRLINPSYWIADLGAAPGGWCEYVSAKSSDRGRIVGVDILEMQPIQGARIVRGDFTNPAVQKKIIDCFDGCLLDLVLSDMSPNISGIATVDQANAESIQVSILEFCGKALKSGGSVLTKLFEGSSSPDVRKMYAEKFARIYMIKPGASRSESREVYLLAKGYMT